MSKFQSTLLFAALATSPFSAFVAAPLRAEVNAEAAKPVPGIHTWQAGADERDRAREALARIQAWYGAEGVKNTRKLYVAYFTPADRKPLPGYRERLDRMVRDVQQYYAREMVSNGLPPITFGIETDDKGLLKIHESTGDKPLSGYDKHGNAGNESRAAAFKSLRAAGIDPENNHVLIVCQMPDGISPYYGGGDQKSGVCWICDLPGLDSVNLASKLSLEDTLKLATNDEERKNFRGRALGPHTTVYMGGTAHELGHCFHLPHTGQSPEQFAQWGTSLMGSGNYTYGEELRGGGKGAFLNPTDALRLIAQPLFSGVDKDVKKNGDAVFTDLVATHEGEGLRVKGRIGSTNVPVYAVLLTFNLGKDGGDYSSNAVSALVDPKTGEFTALVSRSYTGAVDIMLTALHMNGARTQLHTPTVSRDRLVDAGKLNLAWAFAGAQRLYTAGKTDEALAAVRAAGAAGKGTPGFSERVAAWEQAVAPGTPGLSPAARPEGSTTVSLADCASVSEKTGYGPIRPARNTIPSRELGPVPEIGGRTPATALFAHAPGGFTFDLGGAWKSLKGAYGVQHGAWGSVGLEIVGDGKVLFTGKKTGSASSVKFDVNVTGVKTLELRVTDGGDGNGSDWGVIGDPVLSR